MATSPQPVVAMTATTMGSRHPGLNEGCDFLDNDCDDVVNDGLNCSFFAHTDDELFRIDPFLGTISLIVDAPVLWDMDLHRNGTLYAVSESSLYRLDQSNNSWVVVGDLDHEGGDANGMAIDLDGNAYLTAGDILYSIDLTTGTTEAIGNMGGGYESSGDCVVNKDNSLFMSSRDASGYDVLVVLDGATGRPPPSAPSASTMSMA
jgi:hypothetical protein